MSMVNQIIDKVGTKQLCTCLGVLPTSVGNAKTAQAFPARWFLVVRALAQEVGIDVEGQEFLCSFTFKGMGADGSPLFSAVVGKSDGVA